MTKTVYIKTVGCQMNVLDSEMVVADLKRHGYRVVDTPAEAELLLYNTCSIREQAEEKTYSALGKLRDTKARHPDKKIGVLGCMAQKDQEVIFRRAPFVDMVVGPGQLHSLPQLITNIDSGEGRQMAVSLARTDGKQATVARSHETFDPLRDPSMRPTPFQAYLRIQIGCDKFCTYCVVPNTRGPEQGRSPSEILSEARTLAEQGCREIVLLGQTVNSYRHRSEAGDTDLAGLLEQLHEIEGIDRLKFVTNYPKDMTERLLVTVRDLPKCSPYLHVPAQSGSDAVLKRMKRGYTVGDYMEMFERIERILPNAAVSSDFIVGFCGETDEDFQKSVQLIERCRFKNSFIFQYSVRGGTKAAERLEDDVPREVKAARNHELLEVQNRVAREDNEKLVGETVEVLVEGPSKKGEKSEPEAAAVQMTGRTHCDRIVVFDGNRRQAGQMLEVHVDDASSHTLIGRVRTVELVSIGIEANG
ncbi:tRNA (N6-isopentenyl adenosine(37)-C2)-methylthiotransferase MiaB [Allorhodopirellula solitaria]|uniref:tRNA-2-methylthio-N(6)-dimethylallyladenosine synthase n=1 Tax=Allorhodopirellula solitaria TaxID=2527987 RepID=A0A5C5X357_9BACT|nr:tRNA (N6-isopentenyl adenosine(37)-C2)-methylthiotransferase MiaB [Allorhodopirellula solitaria]TWT56612.1 tRNA-2-methylthio-N(6)-dimethylallyladenosine synthase [Allorhodopirellula solitaria]